MSKDGIDERENNGVDDACPFPPGVDLPRKNNGSFGSTFAVDWRIFTPVIGLGIILIASGLFIPASIPFNPPKAPETWNLTIPTFRDYEFSNIPSSKWTPRYQNQVVHNGNLLLAEEEELVIENCTYILQGTLLASNSSKLILRNAELWVKHTSLWRPGSPFPVAADMIFTDESQLQSTNSTILSESIVNLVLLEGSVADLTSSNVTLVSISGDNESMIEISKSSVGVVMIASNSTCRISESSVDSLRPGGTRWSYNLRLPWLNAHADIFRSSVHQVEVRTLGSSVRINGSFIDGSNWSPAMICSGGRWFDIALTNSTLDTLILAAFNSTVTIENSSDLNSVVAYNSTVSVSDSTIPVLQVYNSTSSVDNSVIMALQIMEHTDAQVNDTRLRVLFFGDFEGDLRCNQVSAEELRGYGVNGTITGALLVKERRTDVLFYGDPWKLQRYYQVFAEADGVTLRGVELKLYKDNTLIWSGVTDASGEASFNKTFYHMWQLGFSSWAEENVTSTLTLSAVSGGVEQSVDVAVDSRTPIIFSFDSQPETPLWGNRYVLLGVGALILVVTLVWAVSRRKTEVTQHD